MSTFADRHIGPTADDIATMLDVIGVDSLDELAAKAVPSGILDALADDVAPGLEGLPPAASEEEALTELRRLADTNTVAVSMIGQGYFDTLTPAVLRRNIIENPAWYTAYTPYQPEISQGRLEALLNFQTMIADLTGLEIANASMLDEGTAAAEAMTLMHRATRGSSHRLAVDADLYRQTAAVLATRAEPLGIEIVTADLRDGLPDGEFFGVIAQLPGASGAGGRLVVAGRGGARARRAGGARRRPAGADADHPTRRDRRRRRVRQCPKIRCANGFRRSARRLPRGAQQACPPAAGPAGGGVASTRTASPAFRLSLQTREQHIRRDKATSNICTAQVLLAVLAAMYASYHGADGLRSIARRVHGHARALAAGLAAADVEVVHDRSSTPCWRGCPGRAAARPRRRESQGHQHLGGRRRPRVGVL